MQKLKSTSAGGLARASAQGQGLPRRSDREGPMYVCRYMYVCIYIYIYVYIHICMCVYIHIYIYICIYACMYLCVLCSLCNLYLCVAYRDARTEKDRASIRPISLLTL